MTYEAAPLPWPKDALEPHIGARTIDFHYEKHHKGYVRKLRRALEGRPEEGRTLEELVRTTRGDVFNFAAQAWNHDFYWRSLHPEGGGRPHGVLLERLERDFGSFKDFQQELGRVARGEFGSGWAWLLADGDGTLRVASTHDADNPLRTGQTPLLAIDVWEHAYYLDYQNERGRYVEAVIDHLLDWEFAARNLEGR